MSDPAPPRSADVLVIGAGIAGLVAARRLVAAGRSVIVLEAGAVPGGRVGDREVRGIRFNAGARLIYPFSPRFNKLLDELALTPDLIPVMKPGSVCIGESDAWTIDLMPGPASLLTPGLTLAERLRFLPFALALLATRRRTDPDDATTAAGADGLSLADYIRQRLGPNVLERMIEPVFRGTRAWNADDISAAFFATTTPHLIGRDRVWVLRGGMSRLPAALAHGLDLRCRTKAQTVVAGTAGCEIHAEQDGQPLTFHAAQVVMAVEGARVPELLPEMTAAERAFFAGVRYNSLGIVHYRLNRDPPAVMNFFTRAAAGPIGTYQQSPGNPATGLAPQIYAQLSPEAVAQAKAERRSGDLHSLIAGRLRELYPALDRDCEDRHEQWIEHKLPTFYPGYAGRIRAFLDHQHSAARQVVFCGDYLAQSLLTGAAASGERAAAQILGAG